PRGRGKGAKHGSEEPDPESTPEATNGPGADVKQYRGCDERGDVRIPDCRKRPTEPRIERVDRCTATAQLFANALVDKDVGIDGDADGQHDAGDSGQRQGRVEERQYAENHRDVDCHGDVRE